MKGFEDKNEEEKKNLYWLLLRNNGKPTPYRANLIPKRCKNIGKFLPNLGSSYFHLTSKFTIFFFAIFSFKFEKKWSTVLPPKKRRRRRLNKIQFDMIPELDFQSCYFNKVPSEASSFDQTFLTNTTME